MGQRPLEAANPAASPVGKNVVLQGTVASTISPLAGHQKEQVAVVLPLRKDGAVYTGVITFTASKGVQAELWHQLTGINPATTIIPKAFGAIPVSISPSGKGIISTALVPDKAVVSASIPFSGNALALHGSGSSPFIATYSVTAQTSQAQTMNNITSATSGASLGGGGSRRNHVRRSRSRRNHRRRRRSRRNHRRRRNIRNHRRRRNIRNHRRR